MYYSTIKPLFKISNKSNAAIVKPFNNAFLENQLRDSTLIPNLLMGIPKRFFHGISTIG